MKTRTRTPCGPEPLAPPLAQLAGYCERASDLCDLLESIADDLPEQQPAKWKLVIIQSLVTIPQYYQMVARVLLPLLLKSPDIHAECVQFLQRIQKDYLDAEASLPELQALLLDSEPSQRQLISADALGYALRSFFEAIRRQTVWEREVLLPFASRHLTEQDLDQVAEATDEVNISFHPALYQ